MYLSNPTIELLIQRIQEIELNTNEYFLLFFGENTQIDYERMVKQFNWHNIPFLGGIFPGIIYQNAHSDTGCLIIKLKLLAPPILITDLNVKKFDLPDFSTLNDQLEHQPTVLSLVDGLTSNIAHFLRGLHNVLGNAVNFIGGGAGSLSLKQAPCLFCKEGFFENAAILSFLDYRSQLGVRHGWKKLVGPIVATRTSQNTIFELNWTNAFEVYKEAIEEDSEQEIRSDNFFSIAKGYPFGIYKENQEDIVRDPISVDENGSLICVGEVPENTVLYILKGERNDLIASAQQATQDTLQAPSIKINHLLVFDCISRTLFLEDRFPEELQAIDNQLKLRDLKATPYGVLSLGEISSYGEGLLEFFNKTIVVGTLSERIQ